MWFWRNTFGTNQDGLKMWLRELNLTNLRTINANRPQFPVTYNHRPHAQNVEREVRKVESLPQAYPVDPNKLQQLAAKFARH